MAASLADPAIDNDVISVCQVVVFPVDLTQFLGILEGPVFGIDRSAPWDALCSRDVAAAQSAFVGVVRHMKALTGEFLRAPDVDQFPFGLHVGQHVVTEGTLRDVVAF